MPQVLGPERTHPVLLETRYMTLLQEAGSRVVRGERSLSYQPYDL